MRLVMIEWVDSFGCSSTWEDLNEDSQPELIPCRSVGWLFHDGPDCKVLVPHVAPVPGGKKQQGCGDMTIPIQSILHMVDLIEPSLPPRRETTQSTLPS